MTLKNSTIILTHFSSKQTYTEPECVKISSLSSGSPYFSPVFARCPPILLLKRPVKRPLAFKSGFQINIGNPFIRIFQQRGSVV